MIYNLFRILVTVFFVAIIGKSVGSVLETRYFPVVTEFTVTSVKPISFGWSEIHGEFEKLRDCGLGSVLMYYIPNENTELPIQYIWKGPPLVRSDGKHNFGPWEIQVPETEIDKVKIITRHTCHSLYNTITVSKFVIQ